MTLLPIFAYILMRPLCERVEVVDEVSRSEMAVYTVLEGRIH